MPDDIHPHILEHINMYLHCAFSPDGALLAVTGRADDSQTSIQVASGSEEYRVLEKTGPERQSHVFVWDTRTGTQQAHWEADSITEAAFAPTGMTLATVHSNRVCLRGVVAGEVQKTLLEDLQPDYTHGFWSLAFSPDSSRLAVGMETIDSPTSAYIVDLGEETRVIPLSIHDGLVQDEEDADRDGHSVLRCRFLPDSRLLLGTGYVYDSEDCVYLWEVETGKKLLTFGPDDLREEGEIVRQLILSPDGRFLIAASIDDSEAASLWQLAAQDGEYQWQRRRTFGAPGDGIVLGTFSPDGLLFAAPMSEGADFDGSAPETSIVTLWEMPSGEERVWFTVPGRCYCWAFTLDGKALATLSGRPEKNYWGGAPEYLLHLWDTETGAERAVLQTESRKTNQLFHKPQNARFSTDGNFLAVSHLRHVELWNLAQILNTSKR